LRHSRSPKNQSDKNERYEGFLSDHPCIYAEFEIPVATNTQ